MGSPTTLVVTTIVFLLFPSSDIRYSIVKKDLFSQLTFQLSPSRLTKPTVSCSSNVPVPSLPDRHCKSLLLWRKKKTITPYISKPLLLTWEPSRCPLRHKSLRQQSKVNPVSPFSSVKLLLNRKSRWTKTTTTISTRITRILFTRKYCKIHNVRTRKVPNFIIGLER